MCYEAVECLNIPKALFEDERYRNLSNNAKLLYSLFLDRMKYAPLNGWVNRLGMPYIHYPKSEIMRDLNCSRYAADAAINELRNEFRLIYVACPCNGKPNLIYVHDITEEILAERMLAEGEDNMNKMEKDMKKTVTENVKEKFDIKDDSQDVELEDWEKELCYYIADNDVKKARLQRMVDFDYALPDGTPVLDNIDADARNLGLEMAMTMIVVFSKAYHDDFLSYMQELFDNGHHARLEGALTMLALALDVDSDLVNNMSNCFGIVRVMFQGTVLHHMNDLVETYYEQSE